MKKLRIGWKYLCLVLLLTASALKAHAQMLLEGTVKDKYSQEPVSNVSVAIPGTTAGTVTNTRGSFSLKVKSEEEVTLKCSCVGYRPVSLLAKPGHPVIVFLEKENRAIDEVQVTGHQDVSPMEEPTREPESLQTTIQTITSDEIETMGANNLMEAMKYTVSGSLSEQGRKRKQFYTSRGLSSSEIAIDGISLYSFTDGPNAISTSMIGQIENIRSSNAFLMGYSGLSGVINMKTKDFDHFTTTGEAEYGTFNKVHANLTHGGKIKNFGYALSVTKDRTDGPDNRNAAEDMWNLYGKLSYTVKGKFSFMAQHFYMNGMREFAQMVAGKYTVSVKNLAMIWKFDPLRFNVTLAKARIYETPSACTEFQFYRIDAVRTWNQRSYYIKNKELTDSIPSDYSIIKEPDKVIGGAVYQTIQPVRNNYLRIAFMGSKHRSPLETTNYYGTTDNTDIRSFAGVLTDEHAFSKVNINAGVKVLRDYYKNYAPGSSSIYIEDEWQPLNVNINAGASWTPVKKLTANALFASGVIAAGDRAMKQTVVAPGDTLVEPLSDERRTNIDLGLVYDAGQVGKIAVTGFCIKRENASEYTGTLYTDDAGIEREYQANLDTKTYGIEMIWTSPVYGKWFSANANATLMRTWETTGGVKSRYEDQPEVILNGGIQAEKYGFTFTAMAKYVDKYIGDRFITKTSPDQKIYVGDYVNIDLALYYKVPRFPLSVYGRVINLTDDHYTTTTPVYPDYGRQFSIGVKTSF